MKSKLILLACSIALLTSLPSNATEKPVLTIYTYDSFTSDWGPGPKVKTAFEADCNCTINYVAADSSTGILNRIRLEGSANKADIALGLDSTLMTQAIDTGLLTKHNIDTSTLSLPIAWDNDTFVPFDYGYFAFIYDTNKLTTPPTSLTELAASDYKIIIQDPRSSTPGLGFLTWVQAVMGDKAVEFWPSLADNIVTVTKGWSEAYGLFLEGEADMVLSYTTSPAYHMIAEQKTHYQAAEFSDGHGLQVEVAVKLKNSPNPELAEQFLKFMLSPKFQNIIPTGNWMYPVTDIGQALPKEFNTLVKPKTSHLVDSKMVNLNKKQWLTGFNEGISQ